ncbi:MAG: hypothetical protein ACR2KI_02385 [Candidatus Limnocylindria bacterium]
MPDQGLAACAIGRLPGGGPWVGFRAGAGGGSAGYRLVFGANRGSLPSRATGPLQRSELLNAAIAHFEEALDDAPPELEATHADLAGLVRWLCATERDPDRAASLAEAVDAIDDGLAGEVVVARLQAASPAGISRGDAVGELTERYRQLVVG